MGLSSSAPDFFTNFLRDAIQPADMEVEVILGILCLAVNSHPIMKWSGLFCQGIQHPNPEEILYHFIPDPAFLPAVFIDGPHRDGSDEGYVRYCGSLSHNPDIFTDER